MEAINDSTKLIAQAIEHIDAYLKIFEDKSVALNLVSAVQLLEHALDKLTNKI